MATSSSPKGKKVTISLACAKYLLACAGVNFPESFLMHARGKMAISKIPQNLRQTYFMEIFDAVEEAK